MSPDLEPPIQPLLEAPSGAASVRPAMFRRSTPGDGVLQPLPAAASGWGESMMRGMAVSGALAHGALSALQGATDDGLVEGVWLPSRWTVDLFRPAHMVESRVSAKVVRRGRRLSLMEATFLQAERVVAVATGLFLRSGSQSSGVVWSAPDEHPRPSVALAPRGEPRFWYSDGVGWTGSADGHLGSSRKATWHLAQPIFEGEDPTPFEFAASVSDVANVVTNWGDAGLEYINADVTLSMARLPITMELGMVALHRVEHDGVAVGVAQIIDRLGTIGTATVSSIANSASAIDIAPSRAGS